MKPNKKITISILIIALLLILSNIAYAKPFTDAFSGGLLQINNFFANEQYKPYATTIDFFFFALLFISIYMMGARYAFKEVKRPEQTIVILLGLMTAFLLVLGGFSATILLPYIHWLFYILLFILYWWLLKGIKNKFWRFVLALLLTLLTITLFQGLFAALAPPEVKGVETGIGAFFKSLGDAFKGIEFPGVTAPGVPQWLQDLYGAPTIAPTGPTTLPVTTPVAPSVAPTPERGFLGRNWWWILALLAALAYGGFRLWPRRPREPTPPTPTTQPPAEERTIAEIVAKINEIITNKANSRQRIIQIVLHGKTRLIKQGDAKTGYVAKLTEILAKDTGEEDVANLFLDESRNLEELEEGNVKEIIKKQREFFQELKKLSELEKGLYDRLGRWDTIILQNIANDKKTDAKKVLYILKVLMDQNIQRRAEDNQKGILWLIAYCYNLEAKENILLKELVNLFEPSHIKDLVKGQFKTAIRDTQTLDAYNQREKRIIGLLSRRLLVQNEYLKKLKEIIERGQQPQQPIAPQQINITLDASPPEAKTPPGVEAGERITISFNTQNARPPLQVSIEASINNIKKASKLIPNHPETRGEEGLRLGDQGEHTVSVSILDSEGKRGNASIDVYIKSPTSGRIPPGATIPGIAPPGHVLTGGTPPGLVIEPEAQPTPPAKQLNINIQVEPLEAINPDPKSGGVGINEQVTFKVRNDGTLPFHFIIRFKDEKGKFYLRKIEPDNPNNPTPEFHEFFEKNGTLSLLIYDSTGRKGFASIPIYVRKEESTAQAAGKIKLEYKGYDKSKSNLYVLIDDKEHRYKSYQPIVFIKKKGTKKFRSWDKFEPLLPNTDTEIPLHQFGLEASSYDITLRVHPIVNGRIIKKIFSDAYLTIEIQTSFIVVYNTILNLISILIHEVSLKKEKLDESKKIIDNAYTNKIFDDELYAFFSKLIQDIQNKNIEECVKALEGIKERLMERLDGVIKVHGEKPKEKYFKEEVNKLKQIIISIDGLVEKLKSETGDFSYKRLGKPKTLSRIKKDEIDKSTE